MKENEVSYQCFDWVIGKEWELYCQGHLAAPTSSGTVTYCHTMVRTARLLSIVRPSNLNHGPETTSCSVTVRVVSAVFFHCSSSCFGPLANLSDIFEVMVDVGEWPSNA